MSLPCATGKYDVALIKDGRQILIGGAKILRIEYERVIDAVSQASVEFVTAGKNCCGQLGNADHWNTDLVILEGDNRGVVWRGPVRKATYRRDSVRIDAQDLLAWAKVRIVQGLISYVNEDVSNIFEDLWLREVAAYDPPVFTLNKNLSGVTESRLIPASTNRRMWSIVQEMLDSGLDLSTFGETIIIGQILTDPISLSDAEVQGDIEIVKDGDDFANRVLVDVAKGIVGIYPPGARTGSNGYPLVEILIEDGQLQDQQSADNAAKARYDFSAMGVRRVRADGGLILLPTSPINGRNILAGQLVNFTATQTCYNAIETLRVGRIGFVIEAGRETVTLDLQPLGGVDGLEAV